MKIVITGHSKGVGKAIYEHFVKNGHEVIGLSRSTGCDIKDIKPVLDQAEGCDLFINNAYHKHIQLEIVEELNTKCKMVVFGSIAADYPELMGDDYSRDKKKLQDRCNELSKVPGSKMLYLKIPFLENAVSSPIKTTHQEIINTIDYWLANPNFCRIDYTWELSDEVKQNLAKNYGLDIK